MRLLVINGPNLNLLGKREPHIYGYETLEAIEKMIKNYCAEKGVEVEFFQSNHEGAIIDEIHKTLDLSGLKAQGRDDRKSDYDGLVGQTETSRVKSGFGNGDEGSRVRSGLGDRDGDGDRDVDEDENEAAELTVARKIDGILINPGAYSHYSYAIRDALASVNAPAVEVHISDIYSREDFRKVSVVKDVCAEQISGKGIKGYLEGVDTLIRVISKRQAPPN